MMLFLIQEGVSCLVDLLINAPATVGRKQSLVFGGLIVLVFVLFVPGIGNEFQKRQDPFEPLAFQEMLETFEPTLIICADYTWNPSLLSMKGWRKLERNDLLLYVSNTKKVPSDGKFRFVYLSHREPFRQTVVDSASRLLEELREPDFLEGVLVNDLELIAERRQVNLTEVDFTQSTKNGSNNYYVGIYGTHRRSEGGALK